MQAYSSSKVTYFAIRYVFGRPLQFIGRIIWIISGFALIVITALFVLKSPFRNLNTALAFICGTILYLVGKLLFDIGKKLAVRSAEYVMQNDERNPVLYLRSFVEDKKSDTYVKETPSTAAVDPFASLDKLLIHSTFRLPFIEFTSSTEEEEIAKGLHWIGPCIAAGIPGEKLPSGLGMARFYMEEDEWENKIKNLMIKAELVLMRAGTTTSFVKELRMARELVKPRKLLIMLPKGCDNVDRSGKGFADIANEILPKSLPPFTLTESRETTLCGVVWFHDDWEPEITNFYQLTGSSIRPTFERFSTRYMNSEKRYFLNS